MEEEVLKRIRDVRIKKGYSYDNLAHELDISTSAYRKIELNKTKLTLQRLQQISKVLETKMEDLLGLNTRKFYKQQVAKEGIGYQDIKNLYTENQETLKKLIEQYDKRLKEKDELIDFLKKK